MFHALASNTTLPAPAAPGTAPTGASAGPWWRRLFEPVSIESLVAFRVMLGAIMAIEVLRFYHHGWIGRVYLIPPFHFTYFGFEWVKPWPGYGLYFHFMMIGAAACCIALGLFYRAATVMLFLGFTYVFLLEMAQYLNHFYLICWVSFLMIFVPAHQAYSVDAWRNPELASRTVPAWALWLIRAQVGIAYLFGGIAKMNSDWLHGAPMRDWLAVGANMPVFGPYMMTHAASLLFSWGGMLIDLIVVPLLLWRRTMWIGLGIVLFFNIMNARLFNIGIFPWFMIAGSLLFFAPDWPSRLLAWLGVKTAPAPSTENRIPSRLGAGQRLTLGLMAAYAVFHVFMPLRHWLYPGNVSWTEEGHNFSWHMKLRDKEASEVRFFATDPDTKQTFEVDPMKYLDNRQFGKMAVRPDMVLQFARHIADDFRGKGHSNIEVRAKLMVSLNGRKPQLLVDPDVNLAAQPRTLLPNKWIVPLTEPLPPYGSNLGPTTHTSEE